MNKNYIQTLINKKKHILGTVYIYIYIRYHEEISI